MRVLVGDPDLLLELLRFLETHVHLVVVARSSGELDVGVLGSFADGGRAELELVLAGWESLLPEHPVAIVPLHAELPPAGEAPLRLMHVAD